MPVDPLYYRLTSLYLSQEIHKLTKKMRKFGLRPSLKSHYTVKLFEEGKRSFKKSVLPPTQKTALKYQDTNKTAHL